MLKERRVTWAELGWRNAGIRKTTRGLKFAMGWGLATATLGREPESVEEYAEVMDESRATAFRDQQAFREAFPNEESPARMNRMSGAQARYDELWRNLRDPKKAALGAQPVMFVVGGSPAVV
ncbi:MAG: hypothetical protein WCF24_11570 [Acidimicrobiales bacterium]